MAFDFKRSWKFDRGNRPATTDDLAELAALQSVTFAGLSPKGQQTLETQRASALRTFHSACGARDTAPVNIAILGDSVTEGQGASTRSKRYASRLATSLQARMPVAGLSAPGFETLGGHNLVSSFTAPQTLGGVANTDYQLNTNYGFGRRGWIGKTTTGTLTFTFTGTSFSIVYTGGPATGKLNIVVDGGAPTVFNTNQGTLANNKVWTSPALAAGPHTVVLAWDATSTAGQFVYIEDLVTFNGDEAKGFHVWNGGHYGWSASSFLAGADETSFVPVTNADLLIVELGLNDVNSIDAATFSTNLTNLLAKLTTGLGTVSKTPSIVLFAAWQKYFASNGATTWQPFVDALYSIAASRTDTLVFDMTLRWPAATSAGNVAATNFLYADNTHPSDRGHAYIADALAGFLAPR